MAKQVVMGAKLTCSMGAAPSTLAVLPARTATVGGQLAATIMDHAPVVNIATFGMCKSIANPAVATATSAALGVLTPQPCVPATAAPWIATNAAPMIDNQVALDDMGKCLCQWLGTVTISAPGQSGADIP